jgi:hypothetical protein
MLRVRISIGVRCTTLYDNVCQWLATGQWLNTIKQTLLFYLIFSLKYTKWRLNLVREENFSLTCGSYKINKLMYSSIRYAYRYTEDFIFEQWCLYYLKGIYWSIYRRVWNYQRGNQNPHIEEKQTTQWPKGQTTIYKTYI